MMQMPMGQYRPGNTFFHRADAKGKLLGLCLVALVGVIVVAAFSQAPSTSRTLHRAFGIDTTFLSTLGK